MVVVVGAPCGVVRAGRIEEIGCFLGGGVNSTVVTGRIGGGMPGGGPGLLKDAFGTKAC